jgi:hypothetical protein
MFLFFNVVLFGEQLLFSVFLPSGIAQDNQFYTEWRIILGNVFAAGLMTCFGLYFERRMKEVSEKMEANKQEIIALLKSGTAEQNQKPLKIKKGSSSYRMKTPILRKRMR